jgi:hypothetical protein
MYCAVVPVSEFMYGDIHSRSPQRKTQSPRKNIVPQYGECIVYVLCSSAKSRECERMHAVPKMYVECSGDT